MAGEPARHMGGELDIAITPEGLVLQKEEAYRYRLKGPHFHWPRRCGTVYPRV